MAFRNPVIRFVCCLALTGATACSVKTRSAVPPGTTEPDRFLFERGSETLNNKKWLTAREFFKQVVETYTASPFRPDAKLGIGDTYLGEGTAEALVLAINEFREFLSFYPTNRRADYAQYKLGLAHFRQMRAPQRDQTETRETIKELQAFVDRYPNSSLMPEVRTKLREARDRLSESSFLVGYFYFKQQKWYLGAIDRFKELLKDDPEYSRRDAVYYYLGESLVRMKGREAEALPVFEKLVQEFEQSEHLAEAQKRIAELKALVLNKPTGGQGPPE
jgi:outer membrane protein assembly factor BamD